MFGCSLAYVGVQAQCADTVHIIAPSCESVAARQIGVCEISFTARQAYSAAGGRFRASKAAHSRRGESKMVLSPRSPSFPYELSALRLRCWAARVAEGFSEFPLSAEETLCKFAATFPLRAVLQPLGAGNMFAVLSFAGCGLKQPKGSLREEPAPRWGVARNGQRFRSEAETEGECASDSKDNLQRI